MRHIMTHSNAIMSQSVQGDYDVKEKYSDGALGGEKQVRVLDKLTTGDFSEAVRQFAVLDVPVKADELYRQLLEECRVKGGQTGKMGFMSS